MAEQVPQAVAGGAIAQVVQILNLLKANLPWRSKLRTNLWHKKLRIERYASFSVSDTMWLIIFQWLIFIGRV